MIQRLIFFILWLTWFRARIRYMMRDASGPGVASLTLQRADASIIDFCHSQMLSLSGSGDSSWRHTYSWLKCGKRRS